jgi:hypothetical protein
MANDLLGLNLTGPPDEGPSVEDRAAAAGLAGAVASLLVAAPLWWLLGTPLLPLRVADAIFSVMPIAVVEFGVTFLGPWAKRLAFAGCVAGYAALLALAARLFVRRWGRPGVGRGALFGAGVWLAASLTVVPLAGGGPFGVRWGPSGALAAASLLASGLAYGAGFALAFARLERDPNLARRGVDLASRRAVFGGLIAAGVTVLVVEGARSVADFFGWGGDARVSGGSGVFPDIDGLSREVTPTTDFYHVSKNVFDPDGPPSGWRLEVGGLVARPRAYTLDELRALPISEAYATLACISNYVGGDLVGNALWTGVPLAAILADAGVGDGAVDVVFTALDDYTDSIPVERAVAPGSLLAYAMNGAPLNATHGAPLRLVVPGIYGMKNVKWITGLEVVATDFKGYWQRRGWDDRAEYQTMSRIDVAHAHRAGEPATIAGIAFAGDRGIRRVEVSTDGAATWADAELRPPLSPNSWVLWNLAWTPPAAGSYTVVVRATDGRGDVQPKREAPPVPSGSTGWHAVTVAVGA